MPKLVPEIRRLIVQSLESFAKDFKGFNNKKELSRFKRHLRLNLLSIILEKIFNFLEYLRLKGIVLSDEEEKIFRKVVEEIMEPIYQQIRNTCDLLLVSNTRYVEFADQLLIVLEVYDDWKYPEPPDEDGKFSIRGLMKCPKCSKLQPKGTPFCLHCGDKLK